MDGASEQPEQAVPSATAVRVIFGSSQRERTGCSEIYVEASTVRRLLGELNDRWPGFGDELNEQCAIAIDGHILSDALYEPLPDRAEVHFVPAISGG